MADDVVTEEEPDYQTQVLELLESIDWSLYQYVKHTVGYEQKPQEQSDSSDDS